MRYLIILFLLSGCVSIKVGDINSADSEYYYEKNSDKIDIVKDRNGLKNPFFYGNYIIKPLWAFSKGKGNEDGENELFVKIKVDDIEKITSFKQDQNLTNFLNESFKFNIDKDSLISIELWDKDAFVDDILLKRVGVIPADLDEGGILSLKDKHSVIDLIFIPIPYSDTHSCKIYENSIKVSRGNNKLELNFPTIYNCKKFLTMNYEIEKKIPFTIIYSFRDGSNKYSSSRKINYKLIYSNNYIISLKINDLYKNIIDSSGLTLNIIDGKKITTKEIFNSNAYNSTSLCKIINKKLNKHLLNCDTDKNRNTSFNDFLIKKRGILFFLSEKEKNSNYSIFITFDKLKGMINEDYLKGLGLKL